MNFRQLKYVLTVLEEGSISKAAQKLYISQPALSQQILNLEETIGLRIFDRIKNPIALTCEGEQFVRIAEKIWFDYLQAERLSDDFSRLQKGRLVIGIATNRSLQILPYVMPDFMNRYPGIEIRYVEAQSSDLDLAILKGDIDFSLMLSHSPQPQIKFIPLYNERIFLAAPVRHPLCDILPPAPDDSTEIDFTLCGSYPFILMKKGNRLRRISDFYFEKYQLNPPILMETANALLTYRMTAAGLGLSLVTRMTTQLTVLPEKPVHYAMPAEYYCWDLGINHHQDKYISQAMTVFIDYMRQAVKKPPFQNDCLLP